VRLDRSDGPVWRPTGTLDTLQKSIAQGTRMDFPSKLAQFYDILAQGASISRHASALSDTKLHHCCSTGMR